jgi:hypothetical protein
VKPQFEVQLNNNNIKIIHFLDIAEAYLFEGPFGDWFFLRPEVKRLFVWTQSLEI